MAIKQPPGPTPEQLQAYFLAKAETLFDDVSRIADALEVVAQCQLTMAHMFNHTHMPEDVMVNNAGELVSSYGAKVAGPVLYGEDDAEASPETKPEGGAA